MRNNRVRKELGQHKEDAVLENLQFRNDVLVDSIEGDGSTLEYLMPQFLWQFILNEQMPRLHKWNNWSTLGRPSLLLDSEGLLCFWKVKFLCFENRKCRCNSQGAEATTITQ